MPAHGPATATPPMESGGGLQLPFELLDLMDITAHPDELMAFLVDEELTLGALEALAAQAPNTIMTKGAKSPLQTQDRVVAVFYYNVLDSSSETRHLTST